MKSLYLLRHAKSSWSNPSVDDFDRSLNTRGRRACGLVEAYMTRQGIVPDLVLCSAARRARETVEGIAGALDASAPVVFDEALYMATAERLLARVHSVGDDVGAMMMVGHNPSLEDFAGVLVGGSDRAAGCRMKKKYPTAALAIFTLEAARWRDVGRHGSPLDAFIRPCDLAG